MWHFSFVCWESNNLTLRMKSSILLKWNLYIFVNYVKHTISHNNWQFVKNLWFVWISKSASWHINWDGGSNNYRNIHNLQRNCNTKEKWSEVCVYIYTYRIFVWWWGWHIVVTDFVMWWKLWRLQPVVIVKFPSFNRKTQVFRQFWEIYWTYFCV